MPWLPGVRMDWEGVTPVLRWPAREHAFACMRFTTCVRCGSAALWHEAVQPRWLLRCDSVLVFLSGPVMPCA